MGRWLVYLHLTVTLAVAVPASMRPMPRRSARTVSARRPRSRTAPARRSLPRALCGSPWQYFKRDPTFHGHATNHYDTLSIAELCALLVRKLVAPKAVLFLWVTSPLLRECFR